jgi:uncharacterized protein (TIGR03435 family)
MPLMCRAKSLNALAVALMAMSAAAADGPPRSFELADVHSSESTTAWALSAVREPVLLARTGEIRGGRYEVHSVTLVDLISTAYAVDPAKLIGGPSWLDTARFDVIAKVPAGATEASIPAMLQSLLEDRFHLSTHTETHLFPGFVLTARPHHLLKTAGGGADSGCRVAAASGDAGVTCREVTMAKFAQILPQIAGDYFQGEKVIDQTQLSGAFNFTLRWTPRTNFATAAAGGTSLGSAIEKQLGLNLALRDVPERVLIVDKADQTPTPNAPATAQLLPPVPLAFEVAAIKPTLPGVTEKKFQIEPSGRVHLQGLTLKALIKLAWDIQDLDAIDNEELLIGAPRIPESVRYDVVARAPATAPVDPDSVKLMFRALLADRFGLKTHVETRTVSVLALVASKPRLQRAGPRSRSGCRNAALPPQFETASVPIFSVRCHNTTMTQLAQKLQALGGPSVRYPAIDATGLTGAFDFTINWSPPHLMDSLTTSDPNGGISLAEALERQLGLKLKAEKRAIPVIVIDHLEPNPSAN